MNIELAVDYLRQLILTSLWVVAPILLTTLAVGLVVSLFQSITSIQEQTLSFVPKLAAVALVVLMSSHWMMRTLIEFCTLFFQKLPDMAL
jgi:flagellar biosynthetic protein FliQ